MNLKRILLGGLVAGVAMNAVSAAINVGVLGDRYHAMQQSGYFLAEPRLPFLPLNTLLIFAIGVLLALLYASARTRLGPGSKTALCVGLAVAVISAVPGNLAVASWSAVGRFMPLLWMIDQGTQCVLGTLIAAALYKE